MHQGVEETDVVIVGAGPVGLFAVFELGMLKIRATVVDILETIGGQCAALYPEKPIYDIPAYPRVMAAELVAKLEEQARPFTPTYRLGERVDGVERLEDGGLAVTTSAGRRIHCRAMMIAAGSGAFGPNRPPLKGIEAYEGKSVFYLVTRREELRGKRIVIAGGGDSALDWTLSLAELAEKIYVVHRREKFRAAPESVERARRLAADGKVVEMVIPYQLAGLEGEKGSLREVIVKSMDGELRHLPADVLLPFFGLSMNLGPIAEWGLALDRNLITVDPASCRTSEPGIFAIGDIAHYPGKLKLILCGFSESAMAAHAIFPLVHPGEALHWEYSTMKGVPGRD